MKKFFTLVALAFASAGAFAQHVEWTAAQLPSPADGVAQGYQDYWGIGYRLPDNYVLFDKDGVKAEIEKGCLATSGNGKYSGKAYAAKILMGSQAGRSGLSADQQLNFFEGLENNTLLRTGSYSNAGVEYSFTQGVITLTIPNPAEGAAEYSTNGVVTLKYNRGGNSCAMYVIDHTSNSGEGHMVLQSASRCPDDNIQTHCVQFGVEGGHTYYIFASDNNSVELYGISYDATVSDTYANNIISNETCPINWTAAQLPSPADGVAQGYQDYWGIGYRLPDNYVLFDKDGVKAEIEKGCLATSGNGKYSGKAYAAKILMGSQAGRSGLSADQQLNFFEGLENNTLLRTGSYSNAGVEYSFTQGVITLTIPNPAEGAAEYSTNGVVTLKYNRGGNSCAMYVIDHTSNSGEGHMVLQSASRCPDDNIQTHCVQFGVEGGHTYYIFASDNNSVELYGIGYCPTIADNYGTFGTTTGIDNIVNKVEKVADNKIYSIDGRYVGTDKEALANGLYIQDGRKFIKK